ncbi:hypothetical protein [Terracidiphilus gabretensis]|uniref:hypothetical protein n=1 Tax=Terracidiphilus gabretensis TaxID=1577687 RepID=UPI001E44AFEA|nr:hypothetical protein [Terracidiphilus gabretensis]
MAIPFEHRFLKNVLSVFVVSNDSVNDPCRHTGVATAKFSVCRSVTDLRPNDQLFVPEQAE